MKIYKGRTPKEQRAANALQARRWRAKHPSYAKKSHEYWQKNPEKRRKARLKFRLKKRNWTVEQYEKATIEQRGVCAICQNSLRLYPDHNHATNTPRSLLCGNCNSGLGHFRDNPAYLTKAIEYLEKWKVKKISFYDPSGGWKYGFPREYKPLPNESLEETLLRDGYPQREIDNAGAKYCRFWESDDKL
jgi:hypothetical protein